MINKSRKAELDLLAQEIVNLYEWGEQVNPEEILLSNDVSVIYDDYDASFEGMTIHRDGDFYVHINTKQIPQVSMRGRFTLAHEAGHYLIPEHNVALQNSYHASKFSPHENNMIELEANYFAGALLMPRNMFRERCQGHKFNLSLVEHLSTSFGVSKLAVLLRYIEVGHYPLMIAYCQNQILKWLDRSHDFPYDGAFKSKYGQRLPDTSVVGEYYRLPNAKYTGVERIMADDWFYINHGMINIELNEQCFYSNYGYDISMVWPD